MQTMNQIPQTTATRKPNVVTQLQHEARKNSALADICHMFAMRERARQQVTMANLQYIMGKEGFKHTEQEYEDALGVLAGLGLGTLKYDKHRKLQALVGITVTLQSIGKAAVGGADTMNKFKPANKYRPLLAKRVPPMPVIQEAAKPVVQPTTVVASVQREPVFAPTPNKPGIATVIIASPDGSITTVQMNNELVLTIAKLAQKPS